MSKANNLGDFLLDIANAIRDREGITGKINPQDFAELIRGVPDGYTILEYIEATGSQYLDTGFVPNIKTSFVAELSIPSGIGNKNLFCASTNFVLNSMSDNQLEWKIGNSSWNNITTPSPVTDKFKVEYSVESIKFNDEIIATPNIDSLSNDYSMWLFYRVGGSSNTLGFGKLYSLKIYDNGVLARDFIPVKNMDSGTYGLYDKVNKQFYASASSTGFTGV